MIDMQQFITRWKDVKALMKAKDFDTALQLVESLLEQGCFSSDLLELRGFLILVADRDKKFFPHLTLETAKASFEAAVAISLKPIEPLVELGYYKYARELDRTHEALEHFVKAEQNAMGGVMDALIGQAKCHIELGDRLTANIILQRLKVMFPDDEDSKISMLELEEDF